MKDLIRWQRCSVGREGDPDRRHSKPAGGSGQQSIWATILRLIIRLRPENRHKIRLSRKYRPLLLYARFHGPDSGSLCDAWTQTAVGRGAGDCLPRPDFRMWLVERPDRRS